MSEDKARVIAEKLKKDIGEGKYGADRPLPEKREAIGFRAWMCGCVRLQLTVLAAVFSGSDATLALEKLGKMALVAEAG